ncbi:DUF3558 domain-containing protein [Crossiella sp. SN42]|uniref:DUF3558 domain-containing protein n=1 Tax=Crossiella sp. SN42 TaxID=2944808 RepID=UPI00207CD721|nr:DUF3558 family protein [Crossiella sp. SN42]MCO1577803.1 DUF3558 domain-containing protein [Crossiella sp. SN42]
MLLAGCDGPPAPSTTLPATSGGGPPASSAPSDAPTVPSPDLDTNRFAANPCGMLTTEQAKQVAGGLPGEVRESALGPSCNWKAADTAAKNNLAITVNNQIGGIAQFYARKSTFKVWEPVQVGGYPAVIALDSDARNMGLCALEIGTAQKTMVSVDTRLSVSAADYANPCQRTLAIGEMVVATLKGGN